MMTPDYNIPDGEAFPLGLDAAQHLDGNMVQQSEYCAVMRYVADGNPGLPNKQLNTIEANDLLAHGIAIVSNWETDGRPGYGWATGYNHATMAMTNHLAVGGPRGATIYFSIDYDAPESDQPLINDYFKGVYDAFAGKMGVGAYAGYWVCKRLKDIYPDIKIWQANAWPGNIILDDIEIRQRVGYTYVGGIQCDVNEIRKPGRIGAWQDVMSDNEEVTSEIDNQQYSTEQMLAFIDGHTYNVDVLLLPSLIEKIDKIASQVTAIKAKLGIVDV